MLLSTQPFIPEQKMKRAFLRIAHVLYEHKEEGIGTHSRLFDILLNHMKEDLIVGDSEAALVLPRSGRPEQEHVVPCAFIIDKCHEKFEQKKSDQEVAEYIEANLKIVLITQEERKGLDSLPGLKNKMPPGWKDGDDIMARLHRAGISFKPRPNTNGKSGICHIANGLEDNSGGYTPAARL